MNKNQNDLIGQNNNYTKHKLNNIKSQEFIKEGDTHSAVKMLRILADFDDFEDEVKKLMTEIEAKEKFFNAIEEVIETGKSPACELIDKYNNEWQKDLKNVYRDCAY